MADLHVTYEPGTQRSWSLWEERDVREALEAGGFGVRESRGEKKLGFHPLPSYLVVDAIEVLKDASMVTGLTVGVLSLVDRLRHKKRKPRIHIRTGVRLYIIHPQRHDAEEAVRAIEEDLEDESAERTGVMNWKDGRWQRGAEPRR